MTEIDRFKAIEDDAPAQDAFNVAVSDSQNETVNFRALWVGTTGNVSVYTLRERSVVFKNVPSGTVLPVSGKRVNSTGTTATDIVGLI